MKNTLLKQDKDLIEKIAKHMILHSEEPFTSSRQIAKEYGVRHNDLVTQIEELKHFDELINLRKIRRLKYTYRGRELAYFELDEEVFILVVAKIRTKKAEAATMNFIKAFRMLLIENVAMTATIAANKANAIWRPVREKGKVTRKSLTDAIKSFCRYAEDTRGGLYKDNKCPYYPLFSKLVYDSLGLKRPKGKRPLRDIFAAPIVEQIKHLEALLVDLIDEEIENEVEYHKAYKRIKRKVEAEILILSVRG